MEFGGTQKFRSKKCPERLQYNLGVRRLLKTTTKQPSSYKENIRQSCQSETSQIYTGGARDGDVKGEAKRDGS